MLASMRGSKKNQIFMYGLMALLALGLVGFGTGGPSGGRVNKIGTVGDQPITVNSYVQSLRGQLQQASRQFGRQLTAQEVQLFGIQQNALQNVISGAAIDSEAVRLGVSAGDSLVANEIRATASFTGIDGEFDKEAYNYALENNGLSVADFEEQTRNAIARGVIETSVASATQLDNTQAEVLLSFARERRDISWVKISKDSLDTQAAEPSDAEIQTQYNENPIAYTAPISREISYVVLSPELMEEFVELDENAIVDAYNDQPDRFNKPARRALDRLIFGTKEEADTALEEINASVKTFDNLVEDRGLTLADIELGDIERGSLSSKIDAALFADEQLGVFGPFEIDLGFALFRVNAAFSEQVTTLEDATEELRGELVGEEARRLIENQIVDIEDLLAGGANIEELAADTPMQSGKITLEETTTSDIAAYEEFRTAAWAAAEGDFLELLNLSDGGVFALQLDGETPPSLKPLDTVKQQVISDWKLSETARLIETKAKEIQTKLDSGSTFSGLSLSSLTSKSLERGGPINGTPTQFTREAFGVELGKSSLTMFEGEAYIAKVEKIEPFDKSNEVSGNDITVVNDQLSNQVTNDMLSLFASALRERDGVSLNRPIINQLDQQIISGVPAGGHGG